MWSKRVVADKTLGVIGLAACGALGLHVLRYGYRLLRGPSLAHRGAGMTLLLATGLIAAAVAYPSILLLRYPSIRRTNASEIARYAAKHCAPLTPLWEQETHD